MSSLLLISFLETSKAKTSLFTKPDNFIVTFLVTLMLSIDVLIKLKLEPNLFYSYIGCITNRITSFITYLLYQKIDNKQTIMLIRFKDLYYYS